MRVSSFIFLFFLTALSFQNALVSETAAQEPVSAKGYAAVKPEWKFTPYEFQRRAVGDHDILIEIKYCGICHTDLHMVAQDWSPMPFPMVPGHEITGIVVQVGSNVQKFRVGDHAGVGCLVNSCGICEHCRAHDEQYCPKSVFTYGFTDQDGSITMGGYSNRIVVTEKFAVRIPNEASLEKVAPLLCAGITTYSPIMYYKVGVGQRVGVAGFGGLGNMAVKYALALGAEVTAFDVSELKRASAESLGARFVNVKKPNEMKGLDNRFDFIISTIPTKYDVDLYVKMLKKDGTLVVVGMPPKDETPYVSTPVLAGRKKVTGFLIGGMKETQEMIDFSVKHGIYPAVEVIPIQELDKAYKSLSEGKATARYVIDMESLKR